MELTSVHQWLVQNELSLHPGKSEAIRFASKRKCKQAPYFCVKFNETDIVGVNKIKYIGSIIGNDLSGKECVNMIIKKANERLKLFYRHKHVLTKEIIKSLSLSLVRSQMVAD